MDAEEVDFSHLLLLAIDHHSHGNSSNESIQTLLLATSHSYQPFRMLAWRQESPSNEGHRVVEPKHSIVIFDVVLS